TRSKRDWSSDVCSSDLPFSLPSFLSLSCNGLIAIGKPTNSNFNNQSSGILSGYNKKVKYLDLSSAILYNHLNKLHINFESFPPRSEDRRVGTEYRRRQE